MHGSRSVCPAQHGDRGHSRKERRPDCAATAASVPWPLDASRRRADAPCRAEFREASIACFCLTPLLDRHGVGGCATLPQRHRTSTYGCQVAASRDEREPSDHPRKEVARALRNATAAGWRLTSGGHWGILWCPCGNHKMSVSGTPRDAGREARRIGQEVRRCSS